MRIRLAALSAALALPAAVAVAPAPAKAKPGGCRTKACRARVCRSVACRERVARKRARRAARAGTPAVASWYGPGLYGNPLGCGGTLTPGTFGVAHKTLPCGARVRLCYAGRCTVAAVVDRGPYVAGRDFDLTAPVRSALGFPSTGVLRYAVVG